MEFKTRYQRTKHPFVCVGESRTKQSAKAEADIHTIMAKYKKTGVLAHRQVYQGNYGDFTGVVDYQTALNIVIEADRMFQTIPAHIRKEFDNNPHAFLTFAENPANAARLVELGLAEAPRVPSGPQSGPASTAGPTPAPAPSQAP